MKILFAIGNAQMSKAIVEKYKRFYDEELEYKDVFYFKALLDEVKKDKEYDRIVISEELEQIPFTSLEEIDRFLFNSIDKVTDEIEASVSKIILICSDRRTKSDSLLSKLYGNGIYSMLLGDDRSIDNLCAIIHEPKTKKEAKEYLKINYNSSVADPSGSNDDEVDEVELAKIIKYYEKLGDDTSTYVVNFDRIAEQYTPKQLRVIALCLQPKVQKVLKESEKYAYLFPNMEADKPKQHEKRTLLDRLRKSKQEKEEEALRKQEEKRQKEEARREDEERRKQEERLRLENEQREKEEAERKRKAEEERQRMQEIRRKEEEERDRKQEEERRQAEERRRREEEEREKRREEERRMREAKNEPESIEVDILDEKVNNENITVEMVDEKINQHEGEKSLREQLEAETRRQEEERMANEQAEAEARRQEEERRAREQAEVEARRQEEERMANEQAEAEARREEEERRAREQAEAEARRQEEEKRAREQAEAEARRQEEERRAREQAEAEARRQEEERRAREQAEVEARRQEEERRAREQAEAEARRQEEERRAKEQAEAEARRQEEERRAREQAEAEARRQEEERKSQSLVSNDTDEEYGNYRRAVYELPKDYKKVVALVGANKSGTTFIANAVAFNISSKQVNTALLDMTKDRSLYFIHNNDDSKMRRIAMECMRKLSEGIDTFLPANKFLHVYTAIPGSADDNRRNYKHKTVLETIKKQNNLTLIDCDFTSPIEYFEQASEIYIVQDLDILKLQETTLFLRELKSKQIDMSKIRVIINKYVKTVLTPKKIIEGLSYYNDPEMSFVDELLTGKTMYSIIPFQVENYIQYVEALYKNNMNYKEYTVEFKNAIEELCMQIYPVSGNVVQKPKRGFFG